MEGGLFYHCIFLTKSKTVRELLFADNCALVADSANDTQEIINSCKSSYQFWITNKYQKMECMFQPIPCTVNAGKDIFVNGEQGCSQDYCKARRK